MKDFSIGEATGFSWKKAKEQYLAYFTVTLFVIFIPGLISLLGPTSNKRIADTAGILPTPLWLVLFIAGFVVLLLASFSLVKAALQTADGNTPKLSELATNFRGFWSLIWTGIIMIAAYLAVFAAFAALVSILFLVFFKISLPAFYLISIILWIIAAVLGIIINLTFFFSAYVSVDVKKGGISALKRSAAITKNIRGRIFLFLIVIIAISLAGSLVSSLIGGIIGVIIAVFSPVLARLMMLIIQTLVMSFVLPIDVIAIASVYRKLDAQTPGLGLEIPPTNVPVAPVVQK